jgi:glutathione S-transferase
MTLPPPKRLYSSSASPFGRKVKIAAAVLDLADRFEVVNADTRDSADPVRRDNPLGKIPTLVLADGSAVYDSRVILEYLDLLAGGGRIIPAEAPARIAALRLQALADGLADAALLLVYEQRFRAPERREEGWVSHQSGKVDRALLALEALALPEATPMPQVGAIALACALGYLDLRFAGDWRKTSPKLVAWLDAFAAAVPAFGKTTPTG